MKILVGSNSVRRVLGWAVLALGVGYLVRFIYFSLTYSVNILYWDEWNIVNEIVGKVSIWQLLRYQHYEHKVGLALLVMKVLAGVTRWNSQVEALLSGLTILISMGVAMLVKRQVFGRWHLSDVIFPVLFLNLFQWSNVTNGFQFIFVLPFLWYFLTIYLLGGGFTTWRLVIIILISFLGLYSSFPGVLLHLMNMASFLWILMSSRDRPTRWRCGVGLLILIVALGFFLTDYRFGVYFANGELHLKSVLQYVLLQIGTVWGNQNYGFPVIFFSGAMVILGVVRVAGDLCQRKVNIVLAYLFVYPLFFALATAVSRIGFFGIGLSTTSRYVTYMIPLYVGLYFVFLRLDKRWAVLLVLVLSVVGELNSGAWVKEADYRRMKLKSWRGCYLRGKSIEGCNQETKFEVFPKDGNVILTDNLRLLKDKGYNLFGGNEIN